MGRAAPLTSSGQANVGVGAVGVGSTRVRKRWSVSGGNRRRQIGGRTRPGSAACIVVDVVWAPAWVVSELPSGWENPLSAPWAVQPAWGTVGSRGWAAGCSVGRHGRAVGSDGCGLR